MVVEGYLSACFRHFSALFPALDPYVSYHFLPESDTLSDTLTRTFRFDITEI